VKVFLWHVPAIRTVHGQAPLLLIVRGAYINRLVSKELIEPSLKNHLFNLYRSCDKIICIARHLVTSVVNGAGSEVANKTIFLPNPIDLSPALFEKPVEPIARLTWSDPIRIVMPAQIKGRKRPLDAVHIVKTLVDQGYQVQLTVCGGGADTKKMKDLIASFNLQNQINMTGQIRRDQVLNILQESEIVLLCSENEGRPRVLQEGIAAGKGVVAYDNPGSREVLNEWGHNLDAWPLGRLVKIADVNGAADAIANLATHFRSNSPTIYIAPTLPSSMEVLRSWEGIIKSQLI